MRVWIRVTLSVVVHDATTAMTASYSVAVAKEAGRKMNRGGYLAQHSGLVYLAQHSGLVYSSTGGKDGSLY
ncbi:hypothetical protein VNO78_10486 [Psophocarpus tetragonolobus]|uniref:Uncharacterized protein n=1 Tax=Psophocarpus tetragonolobus TaxID=3891 RepID=A0AAN9SJU8_PSOTE